MKGSGQRARRPWRGDGGAPHIISTSHEGGWQWRAYRRLDRHVWKMIAIFISFFQLHHTWKKNAKYEIISGELDSCSFLAKNLPGGFDVYVTWFLFGAMHNTRYATSFQHTTNTLNYTDFYLAWCNMQQRRRIHTEMICRISLMHVRESNWLFLRIQLAHTVHKAVIHHSWKIVELLAC